MKIALLSIKPVSHPSEFFFFTVNVIRLWSFFF